MTAPVAVPLDGTRPLCGPLYPERTNEGFRVTWDEMRTANLRMHIGRHLLDYSLGRSDRLQTALFNALMLLILVGHGGLEPTDLVLIKRVL